MNNDFYTCTVQKILMLEHTETSPHFNSIYSSIFNINLRELSLVPEFFLGFASVVLITHCSLIAYSKTYHRILLQFSITSLCMLIVFLTLMLLCNDGLTTVKYLSFDFSFFSDSFGFFSKIITIIASLLCMYLIQDYMIEYKINNTEYDLLMLYAVLGLTLLIQANDFSTIFLALELQGLSLYVISGFKKNSVYSIESGLKYFILGALSAAYFLLGWSLLYGVCGLFILLNFHFFFFNAVVNAVSENIKPTFDLNDKNSNILEDTAKLIENSHWIIILGSYKLLQFIIKTSCCTDCCERDTTTNRPPVDETLIEDRIIQMFVEDARLKITREEYRGIPCEYCRKLLEEFGIADKKFDEEKNIFGERLHIPEKKCWFCRQLAKKIIRELEQEIHTLDLAKKKSLNLYEYYLREDIFKKYYKILSEGFDKAHRLTPEISKKAIRNGFTEACDCADQEEYKSLVCERIVKGLKKAWEIEALKNVLPEKALKTVGKVNNKSQICEILKKMAMFANKSNFSGDSFSDKSTHSFSKKKITITKIRNIINEKEIKKEKAQYNLTQFFKKKEYKLAEAALILILISFFFKLALAPFHLGSLDIYEGSPTSSTIFFAVVTKFSVIVILIKICYYGFYNLLKNSLYQYTVIASVLSIIIGSVAGLGERKLKSLLAYSSINNIGYILLALTIGTLNGIKAALFYLFIYVNSSLATWSGLVSIQIKKSRYCKKQNKDFADIVLLKKTNPILVILLQIVLFSSAGLPPFIGFLTKMNVFSANIESHVFLISFVTILISIIATFYYLRLVKIMCFEKILIGKLYKSVKLKQSTINSIFSFFLPYQFLKPWLPLFFSYKIVIC